MYLYCFMPLQIYLKCPSYLFCFIWFIWWWYACPFAMCPIVHSWHVSEFTCLRVYVCLEFTFSEFVENCSLLALDGDFTSLTTPSRSPYWFVWLPLISPDWLRHPTAPSFYLNLGQISWSNKVHHLYVSLASVGETRHFWDLSCLHCSVWTPASVLTVILPLVFTSRLYRQSCSQDELECSLQFLFGSV